MTNPVGSFIWYELMTTDLDAAAAFYGDVVGWKIQAHSDPQSASEGMDYRMIVRDDGGNAGGAFGLSKGMTDGGARPCWLGYFYTPDVDVAVAAILADGGTVKMPAADIPVGRIAMVTDPGGVPFYVMNPIPPAGAPADAKSDAYDRWAPQRISWNELYAPDLDVAKAFYAKHFDFEYNDSMPMGEMGDYVFIDHGGQTIGAMMRQPPHVPFPCWNYYLRVADFDTAVERVKAGGGQVLNGPMEVPGGDWIINGMDPQGAAFSLVGAK
jgi:predicted enzyme related to lactoylglutathione lyase